MKKRQIISCSVMFIVIMMQCACVRDMHLISARTEPDVGYEYDVILIDRKVKTQSGFGENAPLILKSAGSGIYSFSDQEPISLDYASLSGKRAYIREVRETVRQFRQVAETGSTFMRTGDLSNFSGQVIAYLDHYVEPLLENETADQTPAIRLEKALLHLECAFLCLDIGRRNRALNYRNRFQDKYGQDTALLRLPLKNIGQELPTLGQQYEHLQTKF